MMSDEEENIPMDSSDSSDDSSENGDSSDDAPDAADPEVSSEDDIDLGPDPEKRIEELESDVRRSPYLYDKHVELIRVCRKAKQYNKLDEARERMHANYPLSPKLWIAWLKDVQKHEESKNNREKIKSLFQRAVLDYQSVDVWLEYCTFAVGSMESFGEKWVRSIFEEALSHIGGHISKGGQVWAAYRDFEMIRLAQMPRDPNPGKQEAVDKQCEVIAKLFRRELSLPLRGMEEVYEEYKDWVTEVPSDVKTSFERAKSYLSETEPLIDAIEDADSDEELYRTHMEYIEFSERKGVPSRIICAYEEALTALCLRAELWQKYLNYLIKFFLTESSILPQCRRAVRNCPWNLELWLTELECLERFEKTSKVVQDSYEKALQAGFTESGQFLTLWMTYIGYLRRQIDWTVPDKELEASDKVELLRDTFERAVIQLEKYFNRFGDPECQIFRFWAFVEAKYLKNLPKARELWSEVMKRNHGNEAHMWLEYINFERAYGDAKHCRKVFSRAINSVTDWPEHVFEACLRFEREEGTFETWIEVRSKIEQQRARLAERSAVVEAKEKSTKAAAQAEKQARRAQKRSAEHVSKANPKVKADSQPEKKAKHEPVESKTDSEGFVVPNVPSQQAASKVAPPPGYFAHKARQENKPEVQDSEPGVNVEAKTVPSNDNDAEKQARTVFASNLDFNTKEEVLQSVFEKCGEISEIRLVKDNRGRSKGYAYVEFKLKDSVKEGLQLDRTPVEGRPMFVSECNANKRHTFQYASGLEKNKIFIRNLPKTITEYALRTMFGKYGKVTGVRLATYRNGAPKGHAYVDFETETEASKAIVGADGQMVGENAISIALSNPPKRRDPQMPESGMEFESSLGGGKRQTNDHGNARTKISLLPRSVAKKPADPVARKAPDSMAAKSEKDGASRNGAGDPQSIAKSASMSNDEFRKMFLKK